MRLRLSSYAELVDELGGGRALVNRYTGRSTQVGPHLSDALPQLLELDLGRLESGHDVLLQLCAYELASRGVLVPAELDEAGERRFLDGLDALVAAPTFFGVPATTTDLLDDASAIAFLGIRCERGASYPGTASGPELLRRASRAMIGHAGSPADLVDVRGCRPFAITPVVDLGDLDLRRRDLDAWMHAAEDVARALPASTVPVVVGGDHAMTFPIVRALFERRGRRPFTLVHVDQHLDLQVRGRFVDGQPRRLEPITHANFVSHVLALDPGMRVLQVGGAPYQCVPAQNHDEIRRYLDAAAVQLSALDVAVLGDALADRLRAEQDVYLSIDVDVLAAPGMRATGYPASVGLDAAALFRIVDAAIRHNRVIGVDLMEFGVPAHVATPATAVEAELLCHLLCHIVALVGQQLEYARDEVA